MMITGLFLSLYYFFIESFVALIDESEDLADDAFRAVQFHQMLLTIYHELMIDAEL